MPQISSNFILRSKLPNFERDSFRTLEDMQHVSPDWMDEGHISYCKSNGKHYIFHAVPNENGIPVSTWTELIPETLSADNASNIVKIMKRHYFPLDERCRI